MRPALILLFVLRGDAFLWAIRSLLDFGLFTVHYSLFTAFPPSLLLFSRGCAMILSIYVVACSFYQYGNS